MAAALPQYYPNDLQPVGLENENLNDVLNRLRETVKIGIQLLLTKSAVPDTTENDTAVSYGSIFSGDLGIALALLKLRRQALVSEAFVSSELDDALRLRIDRRVRPLDLTPGRTSPLQSPALGAALLRLLSGYPNEDDVGMFVAAIDFAREQSMTVDLRGHKMGVDEVLAGRAGLLWAIIELWHHTPTEAIKSSLKPLFEMVPNLVEDILDAGRKGSEEHAKLYGAENALPLSWPWIDNYHSLGAIHGISGTLAALLELDHTDIDSKVKSAFPEIAATITSLCKICIEEKGVLPMSVPPFPSSRPSPLFQICHGTPGLLLLLACAKRHAYFTETYWNDTWTEAAIIGSEAVWQQGLLSKGASICHGIAGNALPLIMLYNPLDRKTDVFLSKGLAMLLEAQETQPFNSREPDAEASYGKRVYRLPDHPFSLFEGLAGTLCVWAYACEVLQRKLGHEISF